MRGFVEADKDGDGKLSDSEIRDHATSRFRAADKNGDGFLDEAEADEMRFLGRVGPRGAGVKGKAKRGGAVGPIARMDADVDGKVSLNEFVDGHMAMRDRMGALGKGMKDKSKVRGGKEGGGRPMGANRDKRFAELDATKDGTVTKAEAEAGFRARFSALDKNSDGVLDSEEIQAHRALNRRGKGSGKARIEGMDRNGDGKITAEEFARYHGERFDRADSNGDGVLTLDEFRIQRRGERGIKR
jgi:Ca2+-binding EF-hand superfamily protein